MAQLKPNEAQKTAIEKRGTNILVSAAAGSGKTTVLVERVLKMMKEEQIDIGSLIIMTFTRAAAANMKTKIYERLRETVSEMTPEDLARAHLKRQMMKIHTARIGTIDSLCMEIVKENFQALDLDPGFRIADEAEIKMLEKDVLETVLEEHYQDPDNAFLHYAASYTDKNDTWIGELILQLYQSSQAHPDPQRWLRDALAPYRNAAARDYDPAQKGNEWIALCEEIIRSKIDSACKLCQRGLTLCDQTGGPTHYRPNFENVLMILEQMQNTSFKEMCVLFSVLYDGWKSMPKKATKDLDQEIKDQALNLYGECKDIIRNDLKKRFFYKDYDGMLQDIANAAPNAEELVVLTQEFTERIGEAKKEKKLAGFLDVAHYAIDILVRFEDDGTISFTDVADQLANSTKEIIIDEYQDTNNLQEVLLEALSAGRFGRPNIFLVGDVKQSIYGFRLARPELFLQKYNRYGKRDGGERIIFDSNYRSRSEIIDFTNYVFSQIMIPAVGGIDYADGNALTASRPDAKDEVIYDPRTEVFMINGSGEEAKQTEGYWIARRIEELTEDGTFRYGDIAILCRTGSQPQIERMLADSHIPLVTLSSKGFFDTLEVKLALDLLRIVDNPYQDIPFTAVLTSPIVQLSANDLALLKTRFMAENPKRPFGIYEACKGSDDHTDKLSRFMKKLEEWREKSHYLGIAELIEYLLDDSGLYQIVAAMPQGDARRSNIDFLKELAVSFSKGSYTGLFNFIRYIEESREHDKDYAAAVTKDAGLNAVHLMTIHGSKGLEFPVVFLADAGSNYSIKDISRLLIPDAELGFGIEYRNIDEKTTRKTLLMETVIEKKRRENYAEEMRKLYVAMTRARDKLIITGRHNGMNSRFTKWEAERTEGRPFGPLSSEAIMKDSCYLYLLGDCMTAAGYRGFLWDCKDMEEIKMQRLEEILDAADKKAALSVLLNNPVEEDKDLISMLSYCYPHEKATKTSVKMTASRLNEEDAPKEAEEVIEFESYDSQAAAIGSERGTAYHKVFELLDYENADIAAQIKGFVGKGFLSEERASYVKAEDIEAFCKSPLGQRMKKAGKEGLLHREQQFVMGIDQDGEERLIQGIIDAFFEEEDGRIVLVDYKTDRRKDEEYFRKTYDLQQYAYKIAIENATGKKVKEAYLYLTELKKAILLSFE